MRICMCIFHACTCIRTYVCMYVCICVYVCMHVRTYVCSKKEIFNLTTHSTHFIYGYIALEYGRMHALGLKIYGEQ